MTIAFAVTSSAWQRLIERLPDGPHAAVEVDYRNSVADGKRVMVKVVMCRREPLCIGGHHMIVATGMTLDDACATAEKRFDGFRYWGDVA